MKHVVVVATKYFAVIAAVFGFWATPAFAAGQQEQTAEPTRLTDAELDQVSAGDPLILVNIPVNVAAALNVHVEPITVSVPVNVAAIVQANVLGNGVFSGTAVGTQNVFEMAGVRPPGS
jgi:hypothetical protein